MSSHITIVESMVFITIEEIETIKGCLLSPHVYELVVTVIKVAMLTNLSFSSIKQPLIGSSL